ncbi:MAG: biotin--[acetyl-CoA-carboxylase] ligase [Deltaproteobacteria bacterium]|nr:biotin--[acetyl-CoA-carboxylase] ligase [Deltaproteobacteria bacterium]MCL5277714.1 biotin--[acetyl-CoA-carboxylase] ligase [Deltaproteobacteria bacterium]
MDGYRNTVINDLGLLGFVNDVVYYDSVDSTNTLISGLARGGAGEWTVVVADSQSEGRGRQGRVWHSPPGVNIYTSFMVKPDISYKHVPAMSLLAGMVVATLVEQCTGMPAEIKWPNDILVKGRKVSGILLDLLSDDHSGNCVVVGIGINVNADASVYPGSLAETSTSLLLLTGRTFDRAEMLVSLYSLFYKWYKVYAGHPGFDGIREQFMQRFRMIGEHVRIMSGPETLVGVVEGIDEYGGLVVMDPDKRMVTVKSGDVHLL